MARIGWYMFVFGAGSALLAVFEREFIILGWIDSWGTTVGWVIRFGLVVAGVLLLTLAGDEHQQSQDSLTEST